MVVVVAAVVVDDGAGDVCRVVDMGSSVVGGVIVVVSVVMW
jgi:hypothetical protein